MIQNDVFIVQLLLPVLKRICYDTYDIIQFILWYKKYDNIEITDGERSKGIEEMLVRMQASKFKSIIVGAVHQNTNPDCIAYL